MKHKKRHKYKKLTEIIMRPTHRKGAWLHEKDRDGFSVVVPVGIVGEHMPNGWRKYIV